MKEALAPVAPTTPRPPGTPKGMNVLGTFAHHPDLAKAYHHFVAHLLRSSTLTDRQRELVILRVGAVRGARYEWAQHVVLGLEAGVTRAEIDAVTAGDVTGLDALDAAIVTAVDELLADATVSDATWAVLAGALTEQQLLDVIFTVGGYETLAMAMRACGTPLDDDLQEWMAANGV